MGTGKVAVMRGTRIIDVRVFFFFQNVFLSSLLTFWKCNTWFLNSLFNTLGLRI